MTIRTENKNKNKNENKNENKNKNNKNNKNIYFYLFILVILGIGFYYYIKKEPIKNKPIYKFSYTLNNDKALTNNNILNMTDASQSSVIRSSG